MGLHLLWDLSKLIYNYMGEIADTEWTRKCWIYGQVSNFQDFQICVKGCVDLHLEYGVSNASIF